MVLGDVNGDTKLDLVTANVGDNSTASVLLNTTPLTLTYFGGSENTMVITPLPTTKAVSYVTYCNTAARIASNL